MKQIEVDILFTADDIQKAYEIHLSKIQPLKSRILLILGVLLIIMGLFLVFLQNIANNINWTSWAFIIYGVLVLFYYFWKYKKMGISAYKNLVEFQHPFKYTFTSEKLFLTGKNSSSDLNWEHYEFAIVTKNIILLYPNKLRFTIFPAKYFTPDEFQTLTKWIKEKVKCK